LLHAEWCAEHGCAEQGVQNMGVQNMNILPWPSWTEIWSVIYSTLQISTKKFEGKAVQVKKWAVLLRTYCRKNFLRNCFLLTLMQMFYTFLPWTPFRVWWNARAPAHKEMCIYTYIYCAFLKCLATPSVFHIPLPPIVPFAHS
jgi:hypothetical protein